jgi:predicted SAM-dependent methyltransferase
MKSSKPIKLNLGCFNKKFPDYINIDCREECNPDLVDNATTLTKIEDESCDVIEAIHMLEHLSYKDTEAALKVWHKKLKKGGIVRISVPDMKTVCGLFLATGDKAAFRGSIWGSQRHVADFHLNGFTKESLTKDLLDAGFTDVKEWDWRTTYPHNYVDSYASAYYPSMRKNFLCANGKEVDLGGILLSLNLEGVK